MSKYSYNKNFFEKIDTEEKAYWLGFLYADGCITRFYRNEKLKSMSLEVTLKESDEGHLFKFNNDIDGNIPIQTRENRIGDKKYTSKRMVVNCTKMCRDLIDNGCTPQKSLTLEYPTDILSKDLESHFIRGYFDGDGCVHYSQSMVFHKERDKEYLQNHFSCSFVGTMKFLTSLSKVLNDNGIKTSKIYNGNTGSALEMRIYGKENIHKFYNYLYKNSSVRLKRKFEVFNRAFNKLKLPI